MIALDAAEAVSGMSTMVSRDPYLDYQPAFAYSLPIQLFVGGITLTLLAVLLMHLLFTTQYHYPLAPLNYCLQLSSIVTVFLSVLVKLWFVLDYSAKSADQWPYDLDYIAVSIPPKSWTVAQDAAWFLLQALNIGLSNIAHIQFLTLLYPSRTEARLIIFTLGPLAIASSGLVFTALSGSQKILDISDSIRNVLNSTLLLIFTIALVIWGCFVNRRRAWRTDGGTAVFGSGAVFLAIVSTTVNFVAVAEDGIDWLQHLLYAAILWQIWLGWWWWVGSGMGIGEVEDLMERAERKKRKSARRAARLRAAEKPSLRHRSSSIANIVDASHASATAMAGFTSSVAGILRNRTGTLSRRGTQRSERGGDEEDGTAAGIEMETLRRSTQTPQSDVPATTPAAANTSNGSTAVPARAPTPGGTGRVGFSTPPDSRNGAIQQSTNSETSSTSATPSLHPPRTFGQLISFPTTWLQVYFRRLRKAHEDATRKAALEQVERRQQVFERRDRESRREDVMLHAARAEAAVADGDNLGWGLGSFGIKEHRESAKRLQEARERLQEDRLLSATGGDTDGETTEAEPDMPQAGPSTRRVTYETGRGREDSEWEDMDEESGTTSSGGGEGQAIGRRPSDRRMGEGIAEPVTTSANADEAEQGVGGEKKAGAAKSGKKGSWSWWGPLKDWRLNDRSAF